MPKSKGKEKRNHRPRKKGLIMFDGTGNGTGEDLDNCDMESINSQSSIGTRSGEEAGADSPASEEVDDFGDDFEQILLDNIDGASQKSSKGRQSSLSAVEKALRARVLTDFIFDRRETLLDVIERNLKKGQAKDRNLAASIAALLCIQLGAGPEAEAIFKTVKPVLITVTQDNTVASPARASCATSLGLCCFIASEEPEDLLQCIACLEGAVFSSKLAVLGNSELSCSAIAAWMLLLSVSPPSTVQRAIDLYLSRMVSLLQSIDLNVRIAAGEALALLYELGRDIDEDFVGVQNGLCDTLKELATDGSKHKAKKDRRQQRSSFRDILKAIEDGSVPEDVIKFGSECIEVDSWCTRRQYNAFKDSLGTGVISHLQENELLRDIFKLGAPVKGAICKASRFERQMYNNAASKARTLSRGKNRDKRNVSAY